MEKTKELKRERCEHCGSEMKKRETITILYEENTDWIRESICNSYMGK
jgi:hypothetical protein